MADEEKDKARKLVKLFNDDEVKDVKARLQQESQDMDVTVTETSIEGRNKITGRKITITVEKNE